MPFAGVVARVAEYNRGLSGDLDSFGSIGDSALHKRSLSGVLSFAGDLIPGSVSLQGALRFLGTLTAKLNGKPIIAALKKGLGRFGFDFTFD